MVLTRSDVVAWYELQRQEEAGKTWDEHAQLDGTVTGATLSNDAPSNKFIGSHTFNGSSNYVTLPDISPNSYPFTVCGWFKTNTLTVDGETTLYHAKTHWGVTPEEDT